MNINFVENLPERLIKTAKSLNITRVDINLAINEQGEIISYPDFKVIVKGDPNFMTHKEFLDLEDFCYKNNILCIELESEEEVPDPYEPDFTEPKFKNLIEGQPDYRKKDKTYTIYLDITYKNKELTKKVNSYTCNINKKNKATQIAFNKQLEKLKELGYTNTEENKEKVMTDFNYKEIEKIVKDKRLYEEVKNKSTIVEDTEVSLYIEKDEKRINFCHIGYNFNWNNLQKIDDHEIPISYSIIDKRWGLNSTEGYQYRVIQEKQNCEPSEVYALFNGALNFEEMNRYGTRGIKRLVLNKGKVHTCKEIGNQYYFFNKQDYVIYSTNKKNVLDPEKVKEKINLLLGKMKGLPVTN